MKRTILALSTFLIAAAAHAAKVELASMHAIRYSEGGPSSVLRYERAPKPQPKAGEVLVRVCAASLNPLDVKTRARPGTLKTPMIPGHDLAGKIVGVGPGVSEHELGREIYALISWEGGAYAEYVAMPVGFAASKPSNIEMAQAAALPLVTLTAYQALFDDGKLAPGQRVLIHGASGGVGHMAVQLAKLAGAHVTATASAANAGFVRSLGADVVIDYRSQRFEELSKDLDLVLDTIGGETLQRSYSVLRRGGKVISLLEQPDRVRMAELGISGGRTIVYPARHELDLIARLVESGRISATISAQYPLKKAALAQDELGSSGRPAKSVLTLECGG